MSESFTLNGFSFFSGVFTGFVLRWTDIVPIIGGFVLGFTVRKLPGFINLNDLPPLIKEYLSLFIDKMPGSQKSTKKSKEK